MKNTLISLSILIILFGCKKEFLDSKPTSDIINPTTLSEYQTILDNSLMLNITGGLAQLSSDEYFIVNKIRFDALTNQTQKNAYLWNKDLYAGEVNILDWNQLYRAVFYSNSVLDGIKKIDLTASNQTEYNNIKGSALFFRSYAFFDLLKNFSPVYKYETAKSDLGIVLKTSADIDISTPRSSMEQSFIQIINDLNEAANLLKDDFSVLDRNRPSKAAVFAFLARIYLYMGNYTDAEIAANKCLLKHSTVINYNNISKTSATPFTYTSDETIFYSTQVIAYSTSTYGTGTANTVIGIDPNLINKYSVNDLRLPIYFAKNTLNNFNIKRGYVGGGIYAFTGLATDEVMLVKAECAARRNDAQVAISILNQLLINRFSPSTFQPLNASNSIEALNMVLLERRKELIWRGLRWYDLKRLNRDGANIILKRDLDGVIYTLEPNSTLYVFPIPDDEIALSGIQQNIR